MYNNHSSGARAQLAFSPDDAPLFRADPQEPLDMGLFGLDVSQYLPSHAISNAQAAALLAGAAVELAPREPSVVIAGHVALERQIATLALIMPWFEEIDLIDNTPFERWPIAQASRVRTSPIYGSLCSGFCELLANDNSTFWLAWYAHVVHFEFGSRRIDMPLRFRIFPTLTLKDNVAIQLLTLAEARDVYTPDRRAIGCRSLRVPIIGMPAQCAIDMSGPAFFYSPHFELVIYEECRPEPASDLSFRVDMPGLLNRLAFGSRWADASAMQRSQIIICYEGVNVYFDCRFQDDGIDAELIVDGPHPHTFPGSVDAMPLPDNAVLVVLALSSDGESREIKAVRAGKSVYHILSPNAKDGSLLHLRVRIISGACVPTPGFAHCDTALDELRARKALIAENSYCRDFRGLRHIIDNAEKPAQCAFFLERFEPLLDVAHIATLRLVFNFTASSKTVIMACRPEAHHTERSYFLHRPVTGVASSAFLYENSSFEQRNLTPVLFNGGANSYFPGGHTVLSPANAQPPRGFEQQMMDTGTFSASSPSPDIAQASYSMVVDPRQFRSTTQLVDAYNCASRSKPHCLLLDSLDRVDSALGQHYGAPCIPEGHPALLDATVAAADPVFLGVNLTNLSPDARLMARSSELSVTIYDKQRRLRSAGIRMLQVFIHLNYRAHPGQAYSQQAPICVRLGLKSGERAINGHTFAVPGIPLANSVYFE